MHGGIPIGEAGAVAIGNHNQVTDHQGAWEPRRDPGQGELLQAVRRLRDDIRDKTLEGQEPADDNGKAIGGVKVSDEDMLATATRVVGGGVREVRERLGALLLESEICCAGGAYCVALASFGTVRDAGLLAACLDRHLRRPDLVCDQPTAMGALAYTDSVLHGDRASRLLQEGGPWPQWFQDAPHMHGDDGISTYLGGIRLACAVIGECADT